MDKFSTSPHQSSMSKIQSFLIERRSAPEQVGPRVTAIRLALDLSKAEFADSIGLDRSTLTKVEKGTTGLDIAKGEQIASKYGIGLDFIYRGDPSDLPLRLQNAVLANLAGQSTQ